MNLGPLAGEVLVRDCIMLLLTAKTATLAAVDIHGFYELRFAIHTLKLNKGIAG